MSTRLFDHVACPWTAHPRHALLPYTVMALTPRCAARAGGQSQLDRPAARPRICTQRKLEGARTRPPTTHAMCPIARVAARCQPAPCSHPPPSSLGRAPPTTASHSMAPLRIKLNGTHHAHGCHAEPRHGRRQPRAAASCATAPRLMRSSCLCSRRAYNTSVQLADGHAAVR